MAGWRKTASASRRVTAGAVMERPRILRRRHAAPRESKRAVTASATVMKADRGTTIVKKQWQDEAWSQYRAQGELWYAVEWLANAISRVRLRAGRIVDGGDEPEIVEDGPVAEIVEALAGGVGGQSALMKSFAVKLMVPGDSYLVGYETQFGTTKWDVYSVDVVRKETSGGFSIRVDESAWVPLPAESLVVRIWNSDEQFPWLAISPTMPALGVLREIDLYNRKIITQLTARLASNGILWIPTEATFNVRDEFSDAADPLISELVEAASKAIQNPGSAAAALPIPVKLAGDLIDKIQHMTFADNLMEETLQGREAALKRLANMLNVPAEVLTGMADANHWCVDDQTKIMTETGWKYEHELSVGDIVLTLNHETGLSEWQSVRDIYRAHVIDEPMHSMERKNHSSLTTQDHRWAVTRIRYRDNDPYVSREFVTSKDLDRTHSIPAGVPSADLPDTAKFADDLVEMVAWFWTEGSINKSGSSSVSQSHTRNPERVDRIRGVLTRLLGQAKTTLRGVSEPAWREAVQRNDHSYGGPITVFHLNLPATRMLTEHAPKLIVTHAFVRSLTRAQLELFIDASCQGDGWHYRAGHLDIWQRNPSMLDAYELALILSGRMVTRREYDGGEYVTPWKRGTSITPMNQHNLKEAVTTQNYTGIVWCPTTENSTWLASRNGTVFYTGNSASQIEAQAIKFNIKPVVETICDGLTEGYLLPALAEAGLQGFTSSKDDPESIEYEGERYVVWYDASELEEKPDLGERAVQLHDRTAISDAALREAAGFDESSAPTDAEREQQILTRLAYNGQQATNAYEMLTGTPVPAPAGPPAGGNLPAPGAGTGTPDQERPMSRGPSNGGPPGTSADLPPENATMQEIPTRVAFGDDYELILAPRMAQIRDRVHHG